MHLTDIEKLTGDFDNHKKKSGIKQRPRSCYSKKNRSIVIPGIYPEVQAITILI